MVLARKKTPDEKKRDAYIALLVAEADYLQANGWLPASPEKPGGEVRWQSPHSSLLFTQDRALEAQKLQEKSGGTSA